MKFANRDEFLKSAENDLVCPNMDKIFYLLEKAVKTDNKKLLDYDNIVRIGVKSKHKAINKKEYGNLLRKTYVFWYNHALKQRYENPQKDWQKENIEKEIMSVEDLKPENVNSENVFEICSYFEDRMVGGLKFPTYFQHGYFCHFYVNYFTLGRMQLEKYPEVRLYLKIDIENVVKLSDIVIGKALKNKIPLLFKIALNDGRNDNVVFYTDYENINAVANMIEETKKENPKLFKGCKVKNPLMATYKKYMGYGEEPLIYGSYNSVRVDAMEDAFRELKKAYEKDDKFLTKENIKNQFEKSCEKFWIDSENFCMNSKAKYKEYDKNF